MNNLSVNADALPPLLVGEALAFPAEFSVSPEAPLLGELSSVSETERLYRAERFNFLIEYSIHLFPQKSVTKFQNGPLFIRGGVCYTELI